ncbi:MAG TPA: hypothetical protein DDW85_14890 [Porphyromonadaceae bacterium]|nr:hypothetical protein [Porphyromonadaceae bacterium]
MLMHILTNQQKEKTMKRKIVTIAICILFVVVNSSCDDWLTVQPKNMTTKEKMFESEGGFEMALVGLYVTLQGIYTPGFIMMGGKGIETMTHNYAESLSSTTTYTYQLYSHNYTDAEVDKEFSYLFQHYYRIIANANALLDGLEQQDNVLSADKAALIEGEALAIRAFCHFELLRLWGPVPTRVDAQKKYLPYVKILSTSNYEYVTYEEYVELLFSDFNRAEELLDSSDPIKNYSNSDLNSSYNSIKGYSETFWYYRQKRFNLYGVKALLARLYLWTGNKTKAYNYAKEVLEAKNPTGEAKFTLGSQANINKSDYTFFSEHLIGMYLYEFEDKNGNFKGENAFLVNTRDVITDKLYANETDLRLKLFALSSSSTFGSVYGTQKFSKFKSSDNTDKSVPLVRLSEMYLILIETAPLAEANSYYQAFRSARETSNIPLTEDTRLEEMVKEYVREFFSEGQSFFAHKRLNRTTLFLSGATIEENEYILPIPSVELGFY